MLICRCAVVGKVADLCAVTHLDTHAINAALPGQALGRLGEPSPASPAAWAAAGAAVRNLHDAPPPPWAGKKLVGLDAELERECAWLVDSGVLPADLVDRNREIAETAIRPWTPVFMHGGAAR